MANPPPIPSPTEVAGLLDESDLLFDAARLVALNGFARECRLLPFLSPDYAREEDFLVATRHVKYGPYGRTRLMSAAYHGDSARVRSLLRTGADLWARDSRGQTALHWAIEGGSAVVVAQLLDDDGMIEPEDFADLRYAPLVDASSFGHVAVVELLLARGFPIDARDAVRSTALNRALMAGHERVADLLIRRDAKKWIPDMCGLTPRVIAASKGLVDSLQLLLDWEEDDERNIKFDCAPLIVAARTGQVAIVELLLKEGASVNSADEGGWNPLLAACSEGHSRCAELLIGAGADLTSFEIDTGDTLLMFACRKKTMESVVPLLLDKGVELDARNKKGETALMCACAQGLASVASVLIERGADVTARTAEGATALSLAEASGIGMEGVCELLRAKG
jgi:uncharacterized protein